MSGAPIPPLQLALNDELNTSFDAASTNSVEFFPFGRKREPSALLDEWGGPILIGVGLITLLVVVR